jgi:hypothetical protein
MRPLKEVSTHFEQKGHKVLLTTLLLLIFASPFLQHMGKMTWLVSLVVVLVLLAAVRTVAGRTNEYRMALVLGVIALVPQFGVLWNQPFWLETLRYLATVLFLFWVCFLLLRDIIVRSHTVNAELILGAINVYLMVGLGFAFLHGLLEHLQPGSFTGLEAVGGPAVPAVEFIYFSFVTMTTLGYGDVSPLTPIAMTASYAEAMFGQLYLAILVARLVGLYIAGPRGAD